MPSRWTLLPRRTSPAEYAIAASVLVVLAIWLVFPPVDDSTRPQFSRQVLGEFLAAVMAALLAWVFLIAARFRFLERFFGGLDRAYLTHRVTAIVAILLLAAHAAITPWSFNSGTPAAIMGAVGFTVLVLLSVAPRIPVIRRFLGLGYRAWKITHRFIGVFLIMGFAHMMLSDAVVRSSGPAFGTTIACFVVGIVCYLYTELLAPFVRPRHPHTVQTVQRRPASVVEIHLRPKRRHVRFTPGQFVFVYFRHRGLREWHPFTVSSAPDAAELVLSVRSTGDYTRRVAERLTPGTRAVVEGAYGLFDHRLGATAQIWIAGGIGITPFLSWLRALDTPLDHEVLLLYAVRHPEEAVFEEELRQLVRDQPRVRLVVNVSLTDGSLTADRVVQILGEPVGDRDVFMCGPGPMVSAFETAFAQAGVPYSRIHYEHFGFR